MVNGDLRGLNPVDYGQLPEELPIDLITSA